MNKVSRFLLLALLAVGFMVNGHSTPAQASSSSSERIKIGVMYPLSGPVGMTGKRMVNAVKLAFEEVSYTVAGRKIELIVEDSGGTPHTSIDKAKKLVEHDKVAILIGPLIAPNRMAIAPYMSKMKVPNITTAPEDPRAFEYKWTISAGGSLAQTPTCIATYAYDKMNLRKVTAITMDLADGHAFANLFKTSFSKKGGQVIQEQYAQQGNPDFAPNLIVLKDAQAVAAWFHGGDAIKFLIQYQKMGIRKKMPLVALFHGSFFSPFILKNLPPDVANAMIGEYCATPYHNLIESDINKRFVESLKKRYGYDAEEMDASSYEGSLIAIAALKATKGDTAPEKLRQAILGIKVEGPEGPIRFDPKTQCAIKNIYIVKIDKTESGYTWIPAHTYKSVPPSGL